MIGNGSRRSARSSRNGVILFVVVIVIALVSLSAYAFTVLMQTEFRAAHLRGDQLQVEQVAASGSDYLRSLLAQPRGQREQWGGWPNNETLFRDQIVDRDPLVARAGRFSIVSLAYTTDDPQPRYQFGVEDQSGKLSLETLLRWDQQLPGSARAALLQLPEMNDSLADALLDWIDPDDEVREFGAESEFYLGLEPPRLPPNSLPTLLDPLLAVRGFTPQQLLGLEPLVEVDETRSNQELPAAQRPTGTRSAPSTFGGSRSAATPQVPWSEFLTVYSAERNESADGQPRIQLNQTDLRELQRQLTQALDEATANFVVALRRYGPTSSAAAAGPGEPLPPLDLAGQPVYQFTSPLEIVDARVAIVQPAPPGSKSSPQTTVHASPFSTQQSSSLEDLVAFCDRTTTDTEPVHTGRINIQLAPREVLLGIPGLPPEAVERVVSSRSQEGQGTPSRVHPVWLLAEGILDLPTMKQVLPWMNTGGAVMRAEILAYYDRDSPWTRQEVLLDGTRDGIPTLYYRDLRRMGRGFRWEQLAREASLPDSVTPASSADNLTTRPNSVRQPGSGPLPPPRPSSAE